MLKIWKLTLRKLSGANNTLRHSQSLQSFSSDNFTENGTLQLNPGDRQRGSTRNNIDTLTLDACLTPRICIKVAMISNNKLCQNSIRIPGISSPISTRNFSFRGTWRLIEMAKWVLAEPTTDTVSAWDEVISSCRITRFSDIPWNSDTWLSIGGFTCLFH